MEKILLISLKLNFTPNTFCCYGLMVFGVYLSCNSNLQKKMFEYFKNLIDKNAPFLPASQIDAPPHHRIFFGGVFKPLLLTFLYQIIHLSCKRLFYIPPTQLKFIINGESDLENGHYFTLGTKKNFKARFRRGFSADCILWCPETGRRV